MGRSTKASRAIRNAEYLQHLTATFYCARCNIHGRTIRAVRDHFADPDHHCCYDLFPLPEDFAEAEQASLLLQEAS